MNRAKEVGPRRVKSMLDLFFEALDASIDVSWSYLTNKRIHVENMFSSFLCGLKVCLIEL